MGLLLRGHAPLLAGRRVRRRAVDDGVLRGLPLAAAASRGSSGHSSRRRRGLRGGFRRLEPLDELLRERRVFLDVDARACGPALELRSVSHCVAARKRASRSFSGTSSKSGRQWAKATLTAPYPGQPSRGLINRPVVRNASRKDSRAVSFLACTAALRRGIVTAALPG